MCFIKLKLNLEKQSLSEKSFKPKFYLLRFFSSVFESSKRDICECFLYYIFIYISDVVRSIPRLNIIRNRFDVI